MLEAKISKSAYTPLQFVHVLKALRPDHGRLRTVEPPYTPDQQWARLGLAERAKDAHCRLRAATAADSNYHHHHHHHHNNNNCLASSSLPSLPVFFSLDARDWQRSACVVGHPYLRPDNMTVSLAGSPTPWSYMFIRYGHRRTPH